MSQEITVCCPCVFEAGDQVIVIGKESPRLQNKLVGFREFKSCVAKKRSSFARESKSGLRCSVAAVMM
jgi:hypothetical protein